MSSGDWCQRAENDEEGVEGTTLPARGMRGVSGLFGHRVRGRARTSKGKVLIVHAHGRSSAKLRIGGGGTRVRDRGWETRTSRDAGRRNFARACGVPETLPKQVQRPHQACFRTRNDSTRVSRMRGAVRSDLNSRAGWLPRAMLVRGQGRRGGYKVLFLFSCKSQHFGCPLTTHGTR